MKDVRIMKIIIKRYNNLKVLWSSKVKFVSLSQLLGCPLFGSNSGLITAPGFIVSLVGIKKKGKRRDKKGKKGRRNKTRKKERVKNKKNNKK